MKKYECRMTKEIQMTKLERTSDPAFRHLSFVINSSFVIQVSSFSKAPLASPATGRSVYCSEVKDRWHGAAYFILFFKSASLDARVRIRARKTRRRGRARQTANTQRNGSREFRGVWCRLRCLSPLGKRGGAQSC